MASPDLAMMSETLSGSHEKFALPTPSRMPATGSTETGSIMHLPIFWRREKAFLKLSMAASLKGEEISHKKAQKAQKEGRSVGIYFCERQRRRLLKSGRLPFSFVLFVPLCG